MSPRIKTLRKVLNPPIIKGFKPYGPQTETVKTTPVSLLYEEYEALRLCDYDHYNHHKASVIMGVSRPTFTRIYSAAREKIASAFVEGRQIIIEGGKIYFDSDWYQCKSCKCYFNNPEKPNVITHCPLCNSSNISNFDIEYFDSDITESQCDDICVCLNCGYEQRHEYGKPCGIQVCPKCNASMRRKRK